MPLVRVQVKNEFGLGKSQLYREANSEDPKAVLDGVAVAGLVGILRQLGDLAEFAGEVFHGLQEQVMTTASRSHRVMARVKQIEAALPSLEKAILAQTSHIHFAYTPGSEWHPRIQTEQNHFIYHDLPRFILDSYEDCRNPPQLHLLDKFDTGGPGSCLKRYSDPTFFRRTAASGKMSLEKVRSDKKAHRIKRKRSLLRKEEATRGAVFTFNNSLQFSSIPSQGAISQTASTTEMVTKPDAGDWSNSFDSGAGSRYIECDFDLGPSLQTQQKFRESPRSSLVQFNDGVFTVVPDEQCGMIHDKFHHVVEEQLASSSSHVTWDEKAEIVEPRNQQVVIEEAEILEPGNQHDNMETVEVMKPGNRHDDTEKAEILEPGNQQVVREEVEILEPGNHQVVRDEGEVLEPWNPQDDMEKVEITEPENQHDGREKAEMVEHRNQEGDRYEELKVLVPESTLDSLEREVFSIRNDEQMNILADNGHTLESVYNSNEYDEIESETDNYMDALNTIESESETDVDCQTKREVKSRSFNVNCEAADPMQDIDSSLDPNLPILNSSNELHDSSDIGMISNLLDTGSSDSFYHDQRLENTKKVSSPDVTDLHGTEISTMKPDFSDPCPPDSTTFSLQDSPGIKILNRLHESDKTSSNFSTSHSDTFWTNGGLLGLQPSKPPSWAVSDAAHGDSSKEAQCGIYDHALVVNGNVHDTKMGILHKNGVENERDSAPSNSSLDHDAQKDDMSGNLLRTSPQEFSTADLKSKNENLCSNHLSYGSSHAHMNDVVNTSVRVTGTVSPTVPNVNGTYTQTSVEKNENSNHVSGISLLINGFQGKFTLHDGRSEPATSMNSDVPKKRNGHQYDVHKKMMETTFIEQLGCDSPIDSLPPSPPIGHMKISFHPVSGFEVSKLKLKFPDSGEGHGSAKDSFPSFQLAPEESISIHEIGSESDDDTFCRSSPCRSDECLSDHSKSDSDLWESDDTPEGKSHSLYDLCQIPQLGSFSTFQGEGIMGNGTSVNGESRSLNIRNGMGESLSSPVLDLPSFDIVNPVTSGKVDSINTMELPQLQYSDNPTPAPPPLPPVQWRGLKASLDVPEDHKDLSAHPKHVESIVFEEQITHEPIATKPVAKKQGQVMMNEKKEINHVRNDKVMDDRDEFLQQIRTKSFNLRRTVTEKPTNTTSLTTNVKVTAILEKANAIRQAVGSDDGEDDSWSDT